MDGDAVISAALRAADDLDQLPVDGPAARYFTTDQDHFDGTNTNTWQQAYFVNDTFWVPVNLGSANNPVHDIVQQLSKVSNQSETYC